MIDTILFDLDGTLLPMDTEGFLRDYFALMKIELEEFFPPGEMEKIIWSSSMAVIQNLDPNKTNQEVFFEVFLSKVDLNLERLNPIFERFYEEEFDKLKKGIEKNDHMIQSVQVLKDKGYDLIVATNPLFPRIAVEKRMDWAGLNQKDFSFITSYEIMHACKPHLKFYEEVLKKTNKKVSQTMMIGNDVVEDMIVKKLGVETYLVEDFIIGDLSDITMIDHHGNYEDFYNFALALPSVKVE